MIKYQSLSAANKVLYLSDLSQSHRITSKIRVYDNNEVEIGVLEGSVMSGQVDADGTSDITKTLSLELEDPDLKFSFDPLGPLCAGNYLGAEYHVYSQSLSDWVINPVFFGPVTRFSRSSHAVTIEAQGKESLLMPPVQPVAKNNPTDNRVVDFIKAVTSAYGETKFRLSDGGGLKLSKHYKGSAGTDGAWKMVKALAQDHNRQLYYDGEGYLCFRVWPKSTPTYTFSEVMSEPAVDFDMSETRNMVKVYGQDNGGKAVLLATVKLPDVHPFSPVSLSRNSVNRVLLQEVQTGNGRLTPEQAKVIGHRILDQKSQFVLDIQFDALPVPHLELGDVVRLATDTVDTSFTLEKFSLPLTADGVMTVGYNKPVSWKKFRRIT